MEVSTWITCAVAVRSFLDRESAVGMVPSTALALDGGRDLFRKSRLVSNTEPTAEARLSVSYLSQAA